MLEGIQSNMIDRQKAVSTATIDDEILKAATTTTRVRFFQTYSVSPNNRCFKILANPIHIQILLRIHGVEDLREVNLCPRSRGGTRNSRNSCRPEILISSRTILLGSCIIGIEITSISFFDLL